MDVISASGGDQRISYEYGRLDIIIINWNSGNQLLECLSSVYRHGCDDISRIIIIDNASTDGSADGIADLFDLPIEIVRNHKNLGFARACNQGARLGEAPFLLFLNPDTRLFATSLSKPLSFMEKEWNRSVGICGIQLVDDTGKVARTCSRFPSLGRLIAQAFGLDKFPFLKNTGMHMRDWDHLRSMTVDQIMGAFFMVRRDLFESLDGFDERFFVYFEEVDFSYRAVKKGFKSVYLSDTRAYHAGGGTSRQVKALRLFYSLRSRLHYGFKHFSAIQAWLLLGVTILVEPVSRTIFCALRQDWAGIKNTIRGYRMLLYALPLIVCGTQAK